MFRSTGGSISSRRWQRGGHCIRLLCQNVAADPRAAATSRGTGISISSTTWHRGGHHTHLLCQNVAAEPRAASSFRRTGSSITEVIRRKWHREATDFTQIETGRGVNQGLIPHILRALRPGVPPLASAQHARYNIIGSPKHSFELGVRLPNSDVGLDVRLRFSNPQLTPP